VITTERAIDIDASAERVWAVLGRFMHIDDFHPRVSKVDVLSKDLTGVGASRRCHLKDGSSVVEKVVEWQAGRSYSVELSGFSQPLKKAIARFGFEPRGPDRSRVTMGMQYQVKYGPIGWMMGKAMMASMMGRLFLVVLSGLEERVVKGTAPSNS
jgi:carbon monoxide dehydrogenase subunit G